MAAHGDEAPISHRIASSLRDRIESGELGPGDALPTVDELRRQWGCAPLSARGAIDILRSEGRITGGRGKPSVVREPPRRITLSMDTAQIQKDLVQRPEVERLSVGSLELTVGISINQALSTHTYEITEATADLAREFDVTEGTPLLQRKYEAKDRVTGLRLAISVSYIPHSLIAANPDLLDESKEPWPGGHQHQLYTVGIEVDRFLRSLIAVQPTPDDRREWGMDQGVPLIKIRARTIDTSGRVVELSDASYPADRTEISFTENLARWTNPRPNSL